MIVMNFKEGYDGWIKREGWDGVVMEGLDW